jgi:hypothetical protein
MTGTTSYEGMCALDLGEGGVVTRNRPADELATTLTTLTLFHGAVQHADDKARTVVAIQTMLMATLAAQFAFLPAPGAMRVAQLVLLAIFVPGYVHSSCHLLRALLPRMAQTSARNPFAFPSVAVAADVTGLLPVDEQCAHAHEVGRVLARLAMMKHWHIRRAMYGTCALFVSTVGSLALVALS